MRQAAFRGRNYHGWLQLHADADARRAGASVAHYTNAAAPLLTRLPFVLTVHDLSVLRMPGMHPRARVMTTPVMLAAVQRAAAIVVPSDWTARELQRSLRVATRRITVIEHAPQDAASESRRSGSSVVDRHGLSDGAYILSVGTIEPRKNLTRLIEAFELVAVERPDLKLVLAGARGWHSDAILERVGESPLADRMVVTGHIAEPELIDLMRASAAVAYVSLYEGYGMPIIEAMAAGAPVVASRNSAMPQAAGGAAVLVDQHEAADIARGIREALGNRAELVAAGLNRTKGRDWTTVAAEHIDVYRWVTGTKR